MTYTYLLSAFVKNLGIYHNRLIDEINSNSIASGKILSITRDPTNIIFIFDSSLTNPDKSKLDTIVANHPNSSILPLIYKTVDPTSTDDETKGYSLNNEWINYTLKKIWKCINVFKNSAEWIEIGNNLSTNILNPADTELLQYKSTSSKWENINPLLVNSRSYNFSSNINSFATITTTSATFLTISALSITTVSSINLNYFILFTSELNISNTTTILGYQILVNGVAYGLKNCASVTTNNCISTSTFVSNVPNGTIITVQVRRSTGTGTCNLINKNLSVIGL